MLSNFENLINEYKVFDSKYYYSTNKEILYVGSYDKCIEYIKQNDNLNLEMLPVDNIIIKNINLAIIGSRTFNNYTYAKKEILRITTNNKVSINKIISGGAYGADKIAEIFADKFNIPIEIIKPDWSIGKHAGFIRNTDIINKSDYIIAFWNGISKGTLDSINKAKKLNKKLFIIKISPEIMNE